MFIGMRIIIFKPEEPIIKFYSQMGNNYIIYPYAVTKSYIYLLSENVYIPRNVLNMRFEPYAQYYQNYSISRKIYNNSPVKKSSSTI